MHTNPIYRAFPVLLCLILTGLPRPGYALDLLARYPTALTEGDTDPARARAWEFGEGDIFRVSRFRLEVGRALRVETGPADLGIGHCADGAVWALLIPREGGRVAREAAGKEEAVTHVWLRFHPKEVGRLFPPDTVFADGAGDLVTRMRVIAWARLFSSWHAGPRAMIPGPKELTVDVDTQGGPRRFFAVDTAAQQAAYHDAFEGRALKQPPAITAALAERAFDQLWEAFDQEYAMFTLRPEVDWSKLREAYRPKALQCRSAYELAGVFAEMLKPLRDLHVWLTVAGADVPVYSRPRPSNSNPDAHQAILGNLKRSGRLEWAVTPDRVGFLAIYGWNDPKTPAQCDEVLEQMRDTRGLIVDVRLNGGGSEPLAARVAGRFLDKPFVYAYSRFRKGAAHTDLTERAERKLAPRGPWRYDRPVVLLIGQKCMSSNESFVAMMSGAANVTVMGDHTGGSSGNPRIVKLPLEMTVSVPRWIDYLPDGTPLDERGFQPQVPFTATPGAFEGERDDLLKAALERLRQEPLPEKQIAGPALVPEEAAGPAPLRRSPESIPDHAADVKEESGDKSRPQVIAVQPPAGARDVAGVTELRIRFDRPMDPLSLKLDWESGGFLHCDYPRYDPRRHEFTLPVRLAPGVLHRIVVNKTLGGGKLSEQRAHYPRDGFQSKEHRLAGLFVWGFRTKATPIAAGARPPRATAVSPASGSQVPYRTFVEVQFDQPMASPADAFPYVVSPDGGGDVPHMVSSIQFDSARRSFRIPLLLPPKERVAFVLAGFRGANGILAEPVRVEYRVSGDGLARRDQEKIAADAREPRLLALLESIRKRRLQMTSLEERVQSLMLNQEDGLFTGMRLTCSAFKWQSPNRYYGDVSQEMISTKAFRIGSDGRSWWFYGEGNNLRHLVVCPVKEMHQVDVCLCDPFSLTRRSAAKAASEQGLRYAGLAQRGGTAAHLIEAWQVDVFPGSAPWGALQQFWIDPHTLRPAEVTYVGRGFIYRARFVYDRVNQPLPAEAFAVPRPAGIPPSPPEALGAGYNRRFVILRDGSGGEISVRWGKEGPEGTSSSGLN